MSSVGVVDVVDLFLCYSVVKIAPLSQGKGDK